MDGYGAAFLEVPLAACGVPLAGQEAMIVSVGPEIVLSRLPWEKNTALQAHPGRLRRGFCSRRSIPVGEEHAEFRAQAAAHPTCLCWMCLLPNSYSANFPIRVLLIFFHVSKARAMLYSCSYVQ